MERRAQAPFLRERFLSKQADPLRSVKLICDFEGKDVTCNETLSLAGGCIRNSFIRHQHSTVICLFTAPSAPNRQCAKRSTRPSASTSLLLAALSPCSQAELLQRSGTFGWPKKTTNSNHLPRANFQETIGTAGVIVAAQSPVNIIVVHLPAHLSKKEKCEQRSDW